MNLEPLREAVEARRDYIRENQGHYGSAEYDEAVADFNKDIADLAAVLFP